MDIQEELLCSGNCNFDFNGFEIQATEIGFRGGVDCSDNQVTSHYDFFSTSDEVGGKGEGIAGTPEKIYMQTQSIMIRPQVVLWKE